MNSTTSIKKNPWWPLFATNFLSVFNDNLIKWLVIFVGVSWTSSDNKSMVISIAQALLVLPFIFFSPLAGRLSRIFPKRKIMLAGKIGEFPVVLIAILGFYLHSFPIVMFSILGMGLQSSLFSPSKYGLIREIRGNDGISFGTGAMEMLAFVGVLLGTVAAGLVADHYTLALLAIVALTQSGLGVFSAFFIRATETEVEHNPKGKLNPISFLVREFRFASKTKGLNYAIFGSALFWLMGSLIQTNLSIHCPSRFGMDNFHTGMIMSIAAVGIAFGSILTGLISNKRVRLGLVLIGAAGLTLSIFIIVLLNPGELLFMVLVFLASFFSGVFKIPLNSFIQANVEGRRLGDVLAYQNIMEFTFISISAGIFWLVTRFSHDNSIEVFAITGLIAMLTGIFFYVKVPKTKEDMFDFFKNGFKKSV